MAKWYGGASIEGASIDQKEVFFQGPVRYCPKYGQVYASSEDIEGWVPNEYADMTIWRGIRSGSIKSSLRMDIRTGARLAGKMIPIFSPLEADRKENMRGRSYIYLIIIGVASEYQGQGFGGKLLKALTEKCDQVGTPLYTETTTERNVAMFEKLGFRALKKITLPIINLPQWEILRKPEER